MPRPNAADATKAIETRPILLNFMRFLNLASDLVPTTFYCEQLCRDTIPSPIVEAVATLCHFRGSILAERLRSLKSPEKVSGAVKARHWLRAWL
jgi:hypothetical protein